jgi:hypothetical protein
MNLRAQCEQEIKQARDDLKQLLSSLTESEWHTVVISEGQDWTVLDLVGHLAENERGMSIHIHKIRTGRETIPPDFDLEQWNAGLKERLVAAPIADPLAMLDQVRERTLQVLHDLNEPDFTLMGRHPSRGLITIKQYYDTIAAHDIDHAGDIRRGLGREA